MIIGQESKISNKEEEEKKREQEIIDALNQIHEERLHLTRVLSKCIASRYYTPPEILLLEKDYGLPVDMWSVGCIFAELLGMMKENSGKREALFQGDYIDAFNENKDHKHLPKTE